ncbi:MAG: VWA domain-containing protein [Acidobacteriota bacterium]|nr:VWA domain-containing protein [Acidobacteriota bacterium]
MRNNTRRSPTLAAACVAALGALTAAPLAGQEGFRFRSGVELINVTATVTDRTGRFLSGLTKDDFVVFEDNQPVEITHFSSERSPVSLGIVLDTSGSMQGEKWSAARDAIDRFMSQLSDPEDEFFLYRFSGGADLVQDWTTDRRAMSWSLGRVRPNGGTAMYDAAAEAVPMAQGGQNRKKAVVIISDGNDTSSRVGVSEVKQLVRETEVLVYAVGIDGQGQPTFVPQRRPPVGGGRPPMPIPFPLPGGGRGGGGGFPMPPYPGSGGGGGGVYSAGASDRVNVAALREITDDSGGRTEIVRDPRDLDPATENIADELSKQYYIGYPSPGHRDGRWHTIRVELRDPSLRVRARRGYIATP